MFFGFCFCRRRGFGDIAIKTKEKEHKETNEKKRNCLDVKFLQLLGRLYIEREQQYKAHTHARTKHTYAR